MSGYSRIWHQIIDPPVFLDGLLEQILAVCLFAHMADNSVSLVSLAFELSDRLIHIFLVSAGNDNLHALFGQTFGNALADSGGRCSNYGDFPFHWINI